MILWKNGDWLFVIIFFVVLIFLFQSVFFVLHININLCSVWKNSLSNGYERCLDLNRTRTPLCLLLICVVLPLFFFCNHHQTSYILNVQHYTHQQLVKSGCFKCFNPKQVLQTVSVHSTTQTDMLTNLKELIWSLIKWVKLLILFTKDFFENIRSFFYLSTNILSPF